MEFYLLDGSKMIDKAITHDYLKQVLMLPDYYGKNLDALNDCLSEFESNATIIIINKEKIVENLKEYGEILLEVFKTNANKENRFQLRFD